MDVDVNTAALDKIAYGIFGKFGNEKRHKKLQHSLRQARIGVPVDIYISRALLLSLVLSFPCGIIATAYLISNEFVIAQSFLGQYTYILAVPSFYVLFAPLGYRFFLSYPAFLAKIRAKKIDVSLPNAIALMHALSRGGGSVIEFFAILSKNKDLYGEVATEMDMIMKDIKVFNCNIKVAIENAMSNTPSENFKKFLESLLTIIYSGGNLTEFFSSKSEQYRAVALQKNKEFMETVSILSEVYITLFAAGPLLIITMLLVLGIIGGVNLGLLSLIIYVIIPGSAVMFILLLSSIVEGEDYSGVKTVKKEKQGLIGVKAKEGEEELNSNDRDLLKKADFRFRIKQIVSDPLGAFIEKPEYVLYFSIPVSLVFFSIAVYICLPIIDVEQFITEIDDYIIFTVLITLTVYSVFIEIYSRRVMKLRAVFPEFLNRLSSLHESGLTLPKAISSLRKSELGVMNTEIKRIDADINWGSSVPEAMERFGRRIKTKAIARAATLIKVASESSGNIQQTLSIAATDALVSKTLSQERKSNMLPQTTVIYVTFFIFLYMAYIITTGFLSAVSEIQAEHAAAAAKAGMSIGGVDVEKSERLFFHASAVFGFVSGFVAGTMGEGQVKLGIKHALIMLLIAYLAFKLAV